MGELSGLLCHDAYEGDEVIRRERNELGQEDISPQGKRVLKENLVAEEGLQPRYADYDEG